MRVGRVAAMGLAVALGGCSSPQPQPAPSRPPPTVVEVASRHVDGLPARPEDSAFAREVYQITSLTEMVDLSDLVLVGRAIAIAPGRSAGERGAGGLQWRDVGVEVIEVIHGDYDELTLTMEEYGWQDGVPTTINWATWAARGDRMLLGLKRSGNGDGIGGKRFVLTSTATKFYLGASGGVAHNYVEDREAGQFALETAALSVTTLLRAVRSLG